MGKEDQHYSISISPLFCSLLSTSNITTKRNRNLFPPISATKENLFYAAVIDHEPEIKYHRICTNVESTEENKQPQRFMTSYSCNILQQFTCFLVSAQLAFLACCAATRALHLLARTESFTTKDFLVPHNVVVLHIEIVTNRERKAGEAGTGIKAALLQLLQKFMGQILLKPFFFLKNML